jgi:hypothetical protein
MGQRREMCSGQVPVMILNQMKMFDQEIPAANAPGST